MFVNKNAIQNSGLAVRHLKQRLGDSSAERQVAVDVGLDICAGDFGTEKETSEIRGHVKLFQTPFARGIDHHYPAAAPADIHQGAHKARMVG